MRSTNKIVLEISEARFTKVRSGIACETCMTLVLGVYLCFKCSHCTVNTDATEHSIQIQLAFCIFIDLAHTV